ncbi:hypothetical protein AB6A40_005512 [Gnathostoma spinigerum]|uniref:Secreted protein n=1 Tax=Gnathostoma spinigerum TaxID=75299 RepID=A0ABD6EFP0_9BILA
MFSISSLVFSALTFSRNLVDIERYTSRQANQHTHQCGTTWKYQSLGRLGTGARGAIFRPLWVVPSK